MVASTNMLCASADIRIVSSEWVLPRIRLSPSLRLEGVLFSDGPCIMNGAPCWQERLCLSDYIYIYVYVRTPRRLLYNCMTIPG